MNRLLLALCFILPLAYGCKTAEKVTHSYVNKEAVNHEKFEKICVLVLSPNAKLKNRIEKQMVKKMNAKGSNAIASTDIMPNTVTSLKEVNKERLKEILTEANCDALLTVSVLDVKNETKYISNDNEEYVPDFSYIYYKDYQSYYSYRNAEVQKQGDLVDATTYYFESNLYNIESKDLVWSVQTEGAQPASLKSWFRGYSTVMVEELKSTGALK